MKTTIKQHAIDALGGLFLAVLLIAMQVLFQAANGS